jgi:NAD(P)-dependent dehydrogenase (short-subunit alcohol dehydrogenase family)
MSHFSTTGGGMRYNISELGVTRLTETLAQAYADEDVCVCAVHPRAVMMVLALLGMEAPWMRLEWLWEDDVGLCWACCVWLCREREGKRVWLSGQYVSANWDGAELEGMSERLQGEESLNMRWWFRLCVLRNRREERGCLKRVEYR